MALSKTARENHEKLFPNHTSTHAVTVLELVPERWPHLPAWTKPFRKAALVRN